MLGVLVMGLFESLLQGRWQEAAAFAGPSLFFLMFFGMWATFFVAIFALVPALIVIGAAEAARVRVATFYGGAGTITAIVCWGVFLRKDGEWFAMPGPALASIIDWAVPGIAGLVGGLVYWSIAGKSAGDWRAPNS